MNQKIFTQILTVFLFLIISFSSLNAQIWEGDVSNAWEDPANWSTGQVPSSGSTAVVLATAPGGVFPVISVNQTIDYAIQNFGVITINATVDNNGAFTNYDNARIVNNGVFTNFQNVTYQNAGDLTNNGTFENKGALSNFGSADLVNASGGNLINRAGSSITNFGLITNKGTLLNQGNILNTAIFNNDGTIQNESFIQNGITADFNNNLTGTIINNGTFEIGGNLNNAGLIINNLSVETNSTGTLTNDGEFQNLLDFANNSGVVDNNGLFINSGVFNNNFGGILNNYGNFENVTSGQIGTLEIFECSFLFQFSQTHPIDGQVWNFGVIYILGAPVNFTPMTGSVELYSLNENPAPNAVCQNTTVTLDANGNATIQPADVDGGSTALYCVINGLFLDNSNFTCADVGSNIVTLTVEDFFGNSSSCQATVEVVTSPACGGTNDEFCTFTQGFYGNPGGIQNGQTTLEIIQDALSDGNGNNNPIILGGGNRRVQFDLVAAQCIIDLLPGGGPPKVLPNENTVIGSSCNTGSLEIKNGRFHNILLAQTLTLALNSRYDSGLGSLKLSDACAYIPTSIYDDLGGNATIGDLLNHANAVLAGGSTSELSDIPEALGNINDYFDECAESCVQPPSSNLVILDLGIWQTASTANLVWVTNAGGQNDNYVIEHSEDGINFTAISEVISKNNNAEIQSYEAEDASPKDGLNLYRIKEVLDDGSFRYSNIKTVEFTSELDLIRLHPNPTTERIFVELKPYEGLSGTIEIFDARGNQLFNESYTEFPANNHEINVTEYREGIYMMMIRADGKRPVTKRFMVGNVR